MLKNVWDPLCGLVMWEIIQGQKAYHPFVVVNYSLRDAVLHIIKVIGFHGFLT